MIITAIITGIFSALKASNVEALKASLDAMDIGECSCGIYRGVLVKYHAV